MQNKCCTCNLVDVSETAEVEVGFFFIESVSRSDGHCQCIHTCLFHKGACFFGVCKPIAFQGLSEFGNVSQLCLNIRIISSCQFNDFGTGLNIISQRVCACVNHNEIVAGIQALCNKIVRYGVIQMQPSGNPELLQAGTSHGCSHFHT